MWCVVDVRGGCSSGREKPSHSCLGGGGGAGGAGGAGASDATEAAGGDGRGAGVGEAGAEDADGDDGRGGQLQCWYGRHSWRMRSKSRWK